MIFCNCRTISVTNNEIGTVKGSDFADLIDDKLEYTKFSANKYDHKGTQFDNVNHKTHNKNENKYYCVLLPDVSNVERYRRMINFSKNLCRART